MTVTLPDLTYENCNALPDCANADEAVRLVWAMRALILKAKQPFIDAGDMEAIRSLDAMWDFSRKITQKR